jgi:hypothetical protein
MPGPLYEQASRGSRRQGTKFHRCTVRTECCRTESLATGPHMAISPAHFENDEPQAVSKRSFQGTNVPMSTRCRALLAPEGGPMLHPAFDGASPGVRKTTGPEFSWLVAIPITNTLVCLPPRVLPETFFSLSFHSIPSHLTCESQCPVAVLMRALESYIATPAATTAVAQYTVFLRVKNLEKFQESVSALRPSQLRMKIRWARVFLPSRSRSRSRGSVLSRTICSG